MKFELSYGVGPLLYMPAFQVNIVEKIKNNAIEGLTSICLCLEDSINEKSLKEAEKSLLFILSQLCDLAKNGTKLPLVFIRVRSYQHLKELYKSVLEYQDALTGFVFPKVDGKNSHHYASLMKRINKEANRKIWFMPILESECVYNPESRRRCLLSIKKAFKCVDEYLLNYRVGANDLCSLSGVRRAPGMTIYEILIISSIFAEILNIFSREYVVSGPVYDYFDNGQSSSWKETFIKEIRLDLSNGFVGKTIIHPSQAKPVIDELKVEKDVLEQAKKILNWSDDKLGVQKDNSFGRMDEKKTNQIWAEKIITLAKIYGEK